MLAYYLRLYNTGGMGNIEIPYIDNFPDAVTAGIGQEVHIFVIHVETGAKVVSESSNHMIGEIIDDVFLKQRIPDNPELARLCALVARVAVGRLATSQGFEVRYGNYRAPREVVDVELRPLQTEFRQAEVIHTVPPQE